MAGTAPLLPATASANVISVLGLDDGSVYEFGDAGYFLSLPAIGVSPTSPVIGLVPTTDDKGYWLIGADGGIFAFGDAPFVGSLPGLDIHIKDIVGAVPTTL